MQSVAISNLKLYPNWQDAPLGAILAYGSSIFITVPNQQPTQLEGPKIGVRASSFQGLQRFLVILEPEPMLAAEMSDQRQPVVFGAVEALHGPAVDISSECELRVEPAPYAAQIYEDPKPLTVIQTMGDKPIILAFVGNIGRSARYLVLDGEARGKLVERPAQQVFVVGTLVLAHIKAKCSP